MRHVIALMAVLATLHGVGAGAAPLPGGYVVRDSILVPTEASSAGVRLDVLEDERLTPALCDSLWGSAELDIVCEEDDSLPEPYASLCASIRSRPLLPALVRLIANSLVVEQWTMKREQTRLAIEHLYPGDRPTFLVTVDYSIGWGSYAGPSTRFLELRDGRAHWLQAVDTRTGRADTVQVASTLKTKWQFLRLEDGGKDILQAACRPDFDRWEKARKRGKEDDSFLIEYLRYHFDGRQWVKRVRTEPGYSDFEEGFPNLAKFPP